MCCWRNFLEQLRLASFLAPFLFFYFYFFFWSKVGCRRSDLHGYPYFFSDWPGATIDMKSLSRESERESHTSAAKRHPLRQLGLPCLRFRQFTFIHHLLDHHFRYCQPHSFRTARHAESALLSSRIPPSSSTVTSKNHSYVPHLPQEIAGLLRKQKGASKLRIPS